MDWTRVCFILPVIVGLTHGQYYGKLLGSFSEDAHDLRGTIYAVDERRILIKDFNYDGTGPDAFFWVGKKDTTSSDTPNSQGTIITNELGSNAILGKYSSKTIVLNLGSITLREIRWISVWCRQFNANFGWLRITDAMTASLPGPRRINPFSQLAHQVRSGDVTIMDVNTINIKNMHYDGFGPDAFFLIGKGTVSGSATKIPDEHGSLGIVKGYNGTGEMTLHLPAGTTFYDIDYLSLYCIRFTQNFGQVDFNNLPANSLVPDIEQFMVKKNCETLKEDVFNVAWEINGNDAIIELTAAADAGDYLAFGISGNPGYAAMINGDVTVVWKKGDVTFAEDYYMRGYSLCSGTSGVCPDTVDGGSKDVQLIEYSRVNGIITAKYRRTLVSSDSAHDKAIQMNSNSQIIWAIGGVNNQNQVTKHHTRITTSKQIQFGRTASYNCRPVKPKDDGGSGTNNVSWKKQVLYAKDGDLLVASIGPTGGKKGYEAVTGQQSWGIAWYINGLLIPEITVRRGSKVIFRVQGGDKPTNSAKYHPLYITNDPIGGYADKTNAQKQNIKIYQVKSPRSTMVDEMKGRYCEYQAPVGTNPDNLDSFDDFKIRLQLRCDDGLPGDYIWEVAQDTPDTVYYQCYTHNNLGWKINVVDSASGGASYLSWNFMLQVLSSVVLVH